jgi:ferric-dicitrate binding protein FerR (iron transport regulator)
MWATLLTVLLDFIAKTIAIQSRKVGGDAPANADAKQRLDARLAAWKRRSGAPVVLAACLALSGCAGPRVVFLPASEAPVRAGPGMRGRVWVWDGTQWELSANRVDVPEGFYIWSVNGDEVPTK